MRFGVLGPLEVRKGGPSQPGETLQVPGAKERLLLAVLASEVNRPVSVDRLVENLWSGSAPPSASKSLQVHIVRLRSALEPTRPRGSSGQYVVRRGSGYALTVDQEDVDASNFAARVARGRALGEAGSPVEGRAELEVALALWRGTPYAEWPDATWADAERHRLSALKLSALESMADVDLALGRHADAALALNELVVDHPFQEGLWSRLVLALYRDGRQHEALQALRKVRRLLSEELGLDPGPDLERLEQRVLAHDPTLDVAAIEPSVPSPRVSGEQPPCPYKGLAVYQAADAELFHGRARLVATLAARLVDHQIVVVSGPSGSGKSSAVRAGLVPALRHGALPASATWTPVVITPGKRPADALGAAVPVDGSPVVLVLDQLEEVWTAGAPEAEQRAFFDEILGMLDDGRAVRVVVVVRGDHLGRLAEHAAFGERASHGLVLAPPLTDEELREVVEAPAAAVGLQVDKELTAAVVADVRGQVGALPLLSTALVGTWERRRGPSLTLAGYLEAGGVAGALSRAAEDAYARLDDDARRVAPAMLVRLAETGAGGEPVRRKVPIDELAIGGQLAGARHRVIELFVQRRLLSVDAGLIEVAHEALLRSWPRLVGWLDDDDAARQVRSRVAPAALDWVQHGRPHDELYQGARLSSAIDWAAQHPDDLTPVEREFVDASRLAAEAALREAEERATTAALGRRRTRRLALGLTVALVLTLVAAGLAAQQQRRADDRAEEASQASAVADANRLAAVAGANKDLDLSLLLAAEAVRVADTPDTRDGLLSTLVEHRQVLGMHRVPVGRPQQAAVAGGGRVLVTILNMGPVLAWDLTDSGPPRDLMPDNGPDQPRDLAVSPDGELVAVTVGNGVRVRDLEGGHRLDLDAEAFGGAAWNLVFEPDGGHLLVAVAIFEDPFRPPSTMALVRVDLATGAIRPLGVRETAPGGNEIGVDLADDASAALFWSAAPGGVATLHDLATGRRSRVRPDDGDTTPVTGFQLLPSGVAELHDGGSFMIHDLSSGRLEQRLSGHLSDVRRVRASPDGRTVVSVAGDRRVVVWDVRDGTLTQREVLTGHAGRVVDAAFSPDGKRLYTASLDGTLIGWDLANEQRFGLPIPGVPAGRYVSNRPAAADGVWVVPTRPVPGDRPEADVAVEATFIQPGSGTVLASVPVGDTVPFTSYGSSVAASPDGSQVVVTSGWRTTLLDVATRRVLGELVLPAPAGQREPEAVWGSAWSADGRRIFLAGDGRLDDTPEDGRVIVVNARTMKVTARIDVGGDVQTIAVSPDGRWLAAALEEIPKVTLVDLTRPASRAHELPPGPGADLTLDVAFSPDSTRVAAGGHTGTLSVWTLASRTLVREPARLHTGFLLDVNWLPDGDTVATAGSDGRAVLYDMTRGLIRGQPLPVQADGGEGAGFLVPATGDRLVVLDVEGGGQLYPLRTSAWLAHACLVAGRDMTRAEWRSFVPDRPYRQTCGDLAHG